MAADMANWPPLTYDLNYTIGVLEVYGNFNHVPLTQDQIVYQLSHYHESKQPSLIAGTVVMIVATAAAVMLRLLSRKVKKAPLGADDYMALVGLIFFFGYSAPFFLIIHYGLGLHSFRAGAYNFLHIGRPYYVWECLYGPVTYTTKMSVMLLYRRVFVITSRAWRICFWTIVVLFSLWTIANFFKDVFQAIPIRAHWTLVPDAKWIDILLSFFITGLINGVLTLAILILPMPLVWNMHMSMSRRIGICVLFTLGCGDIFVIIARLVLNQREQFPNTDFTWSVIPTSILSIVEQCIGILCASLPMTGSVLIHIFNPRRSRPNHSSDYSEEEQRIRRIRAWASTETASTALSKGNSNNNNNNSKPVRKMPDNHEEEEEEERFNFALPNEYKGGEDQVYMERNLGVYPLSKIESGYDSRSVARLT